MRILNYCFCSFLMFGSIFVTAHATPADLVPSNCPRFLQINANELAEVLASLDGFGTDYLGRKKPAHHKLTTSELVTLKKIKNPKAYRSREHHFLFNNVELTFMGAEESTAMRVFKFEKHVTAHIGIEFRIIEVNLNGQTQVRGLLKIGDGSNSAAPVSLAAMLGSSGTGSINHLDAENGVVHDGLSYRFSTHKFVELHVPEEGKRGEPTWVPTGSAALWIDVFVGANGDLKASFNGYGVKR